MLSIPKRYPGSVALLIFVVLMAAIIFLSYAELARMVDNWLTRGEYGHGILIPFIFGYMLWERKKQLLQRTWGEGTLGIWITLVGCFFLLLGEYSAISALAQFAVILTFIGLSCALLGSWGFKKTILSFVVLFFMIPLPAVIFYGLSDKLQLVSSKLSVVFIRLLGIPVFLEGNIIDLGVSKLEVVEACNGLRYLLPLLCLSVIAIYFYRGNWAKKLFIILFSIPLAVFLNSSRIAATAWIVLNLGSEASEGFAHDFEGWIVFLFGAIVLGGLIWLMHKFDRKKGSATESEDATAAEASPGSWRGRSFWISCVLIALTLPLLVLAQNRPSPIQERKAFRDFPEQIADWKQVAVDRLSPEVCEALGLSDYLLRDYADPAGKRVNLYAAYYADQKKGKSVHSPKACLPGAGWRIIDSSAVSVVLSGPDGKRVQVNRDIVQKGGQRILVYYWFKQRERYVTDEYLIKLYLFYDSVVRNRTDGALVRVLFELSDDDTLADADKTIEEFISTLGPVLPEFIPD